MKKIFLLALVILAAAIAVGTSSAKGQPSPLVLEGSNIGFFQYDTRIEQQSWFDCSKWPDCWDPNHTILSPGVLQVGSWDINDHMSANTSGYLSGQSSTSITPWRHTWDSGSLYVCRPTCGVWNGITHSWGAYVISPSPTLVLTVCISSRCFSPSPLYNASEKAYDYYFCGQINYHWDDPAMVPIPGSAGADGVEGIGDTEYNTVNLYNPGPANNKGIVKNIIVGWGLSSDLVTALGCSNNSYLSGAAPSRDLPRTYNYPYVWFQS